ncbi:iron-containing alcohol dehydrogenase family protein [Desulforamulus hydrothermalis]|uniref:Iron-containing alcohol dehydrogenase n=1 Tax=Desulforamulus hydrothermalis Lam5 = DSM 18033 TaxID=1121428 RepID=K8DYI3_9FIRM|nr:iron-containing alcohol dehydrogenase family protein [Desulforamulus hydrothermalis]CCO07937.1 Iron-containing alcohol dehydrogenase [Desulforamulus hydrothermalis Lam5 = DSM 18033]SHG85854.1 Alcohol dehydrogenase, class IV [Desulforamulus hydrothermalis Lam5 = DSM 18033]
MQFNFRCPTRIFFGQQCIDKYSGELAPLGKKALIVTGGSSSQRNGSLADMLAALNRQGIQAEVFQEVEQNPGLATVYRGGQRAREMGADFIIGIGGGSPLDAAKAVAVLAVNQVSRQELMARQWTNEPLPVVAVPTTAGTGSEVTPYAILTVEWAETKMSIAGEKLFPVLAFLDARYMLNLPWEITVNTAVDALSHSVEGFINRRATPLTDLLALESIAILGRVLTRCKPADLSLAEREELLYASLLAGLVIAQTATGVIHALGYPLTYFKGLPHGLANGVIMKASLEFMAQAAPERVQQVVKALGCSNLSQVGEFLNKMLAPVDFRLTAEEAAKFATKTLSAKNLANCPAAPAEQDIYQILKDSRLL